MDDIKNLTKRQTDSNDNQINVAANKKKEFNINEIKKICKAIKESTSEDFEPEKIVGLFDNFLNHPDKLKRILYYEISNFIFSLNKEDKDVFLSNLQQLFDYTVENVKTEDISKIIIKFYDHCLLATRQLDTMDKEIATTTEIFKKKLQEEFAKQIEETESKFKKELKLIEKEYITILGIFAAIVLTFNIYSVFTSSVLENINDTNVFTLVFIVDLIAMVLLNALYFLMRFLTALNGINAVKIKPFDIKFFNIIMFALLLFVPCAWILQFDELRDSLNNFSCEHVIYSVLVGSFIIYMIVEWKKKNNENK